MPDQPIEIRNELLQTLRDAAADRPAHTKFLERCILLADQVGADVFDGVEYEDIKGVSFPVAVAIEGDVVRAYGFAGGGLEYPGMRAASRTAAAKSARTKGTAEHGLGNLLRF